MIANLNQILETIGVPKTLWTGDRGFLFLSLLCAFLVALAATPLVRRLALAYGLVDSPSVRKVHRRPVPRIGGVALFLAVVAGILPLFLFSRHPEVVRGADLAKIVTFLGCGAAIFLLGLWDDVKGLRASTKFFAQVLLALLVTIQGVRIQTLTLPGILSNPLDFGFLAWPLTILWIVGITNAVNLIDGLDGLAAGISGVACAAIGFLAVSQGHYLMGSIAAALFGAVLGFLVFNFNPARIFMGDSGSLFLGFMLGAGSVLFTGKSATMVGLALPLLALGIPIFDTLFCMLRRFLERRSIFSPDRSHIHHRLLDMGFTHRKVVLILYGVTFLITATGTWLMVVERRQVLLGFMAVLVVLLLFFRLAGAVRLRATLTGIKEKVNLARRKNQVQRALEDLELQFQYATEFEEWWRAVTQAAEALGFSRVSLKTERRDGGRLVWRWARMDAGPRTEATQITTLPVPQRREGSHMVLQVEVDRPQSLEEVSFLFQSLARLIDRRPVADLPRDQRTKVMTV